MDDQIVAAEEAWKSAYAAYKLSWQTYVDLCREANQCLSVGCREARSGGDYCTEHDTDPEDAEWT